MEKGYGDKISENPLIVKFNFSNPEEENVAKFEGYEELYKPEFYLQDRENVCAVCEATTDGNKDFARF